MMVVGLHLSASIPAFSWHVTYRVTKWHLPLLYLLPLDRSFRAEMELLSRMLLLSLLSAGDVYQARSLFLYDLNQNTAFFLLFTFWSPVLHAVL